jgi:hypothetical protein
VRVREPNGEIGLGHWLRTQEFLRKELELSRGGEQLSQRVSREWIDRQRAHQPRRWTLAGVEGSDNGLKTFADVAVPPSTTPIDVRAESPVPNRECSSGPKRNLKSQAHSIGAEIERAT